MILLARAFRSNRPAVVHTHFGHLSAFHRRFANALDAPLIASFYGFEATERKYTDSAEWRARYGRLFRDSAAILAEGPAMAGRIQALGCAADKIQVIRLPADAAGLADISRGTPDEFVVVGPGRAEEEKKGFDVAVEAFARALKGRAARLELVGGPAAAQLRRRAADLGIESQVTWLGRLPFAEFMTKVARASVAVFPSRRAADGASEGGAPVTLIETQWIGVPVVVSDHDDLPFVSAPQGSVVLPPQDVDAWAEVLRGLYDEPGRLHRMGAAAATFARSNHDPTTNARAREALYEAVQ
jgi:colanic acid/amylovoran biosynthesis glycosyltransferase